MPELETSAFIIPGDRVKNDEDRLVVLNHVARSVVESQRGVHSEYVFAYIPAQRKVEPGDTREVPVPRAVRAMNATPWRNARVRAATKWEEEDKAAGPRGIS